MGKQIYLYVLGYLKINGEPFKPRELRLWLQKALPDRDIHQPTLFRILKRLVERRVVTKLRAGYYARSSWKPHYKIFKTPSEVRKKQREYDKARYERKKFLSQVAENPFE